MTQYAVTYSFGRQREDTMLDSTRTARIAALALAGATVGLTALAALLCPEATRLAPLALTLPFVTMAILELVLERDRTRAS
jgi:hypothetical protein